VTESGSSSNTTDLRISPGELTVQGTGQERTVSVVLTNVTGGIGTFDNITLTVSETGVAEVTAITTDTFSNANTGVYGNGTAAYASLPFGRDTMDTGNVTMATATLTTTGTGATAIALSHGDIADEIGSLYQIHSSVDAAITVREATGPPAVVGRDPPTDVDDDGQFEDLNGNGELDIGDVQALFANRQGDAIQNNVDAFDFNDNDGIDIGDIQALFSELQES